MLGIVLAGGFSTRFGGGDKFLTVLPGSAETLLHHAVRTLSGVRGIDRVCISCRSEQMPLIRTVLPDACLFPDPPDKPVANPIFGVISALDAAGSAILVIPCDAPLLSSGHLNMLQDMRELSLRKDAQPALLRCAFVHSDARVETLIATYEYGCLPFLKKAVANGRYGLYSAIPKDRQKLVPCPESRAFYNMNSQADFQKIAAVMSGAT